ncbi:MAG: A/G-specific adenine glycosylase [Paracoccaceae bacterium]
MVRVFSLQNSITSPRANPADLLAWYDRHHRSMPWRVSPAERKLGFAPDPYRVWLSEVMLQQTTVATVVDYFVKFTTRWPDVHALANAPREDLLAAWAGLGYYARARNLHACAQVVSHDLDGVFPNSEDDLRALPGIGPYTAAAIASIAFDQPAVVMDGNVERVMSRLHAVETPLPDSKPELKELAARLTPQTRPGDYAQAVMDLGATICTPKRPACALCPWRTACLATVQGIAERLPAKRRKAAKPIRHGHVWVAFDDEGRVLTVRRPDKGLLGGMLGLPTTAWDSRSDAPDGDAPLRAKWEKIGAVKHTFTHFHLVLTVESASVKRLPEGAAMDAEQADNAMPTVFAKALRLARGSDA